MNKALFFNRSYFAVQTSYDKNHINIHFKQNLKYCSLATIIAYQTLTMYTFSNLRHTSTHMEYTKFRRQTWYETGRGQEGEVGVGGGGGEGSRAEVAELALGK